jgi:hypothetical protein
MRFTVSDVETLLGMPFPKDFGVVNDETDVKVLEEADGIRIIAEAHSWELEMMNRIMKAALSLKLEPEQLVSNQFWMCDTYGEYASPYMEIDVTFLWRAPREVIEVGETNAEQTSECCQLVAAVHSDLSSDPERRPLNDCRDRDESPTSTSEAIEAVLSDLREVMGRMRQLSGTSPQ